MLESIKNHEELIAGTKNLAIHYRIKKVEKTAFQVKLQKLSTAKTPEITL